MVSTRYIISFIRVEIRHEMTSEIHRNLSEYPLLYINMLHCNLVKEEGVRVITELNVEEEIIKLKVELESLAKIHHYNFQHPEVITLSQQLDKLIILVMKKGIRT